jgi:hypothetical protein
MTYDKMTTQTPILEKFYRYKFIKLSIKPCHSCHPVINNQFSVNTPLVCGLNRTWSALGTGGAPC